MFENIKRDYVIHKQDLKNPALWALVIYRFGVWSQNRKNGFARWITSKIYGLLWLFQITITGISMAREVKIGKDFHIIHHGLVYIHPGVVIGDRCGIMHGVTIGTNNTSGMRKGVPTIGDDVFIGPGACILGNVKIGNFARIGPNSLVVDDVSDDACVIGVPAKDVANPSLLRMLREQQEKKEIRKKITEIGL